MLTRRHFIQLTGAAGAGMVLAGHSDIFTAFADEGGTPPLRKYVDQLPTNIPVPSPDTLAYPGADFYEITLKPGMWRFHSQLPMPTPTWGYWGLDPKTGSHGSVGLGYLGPTIEARSGRPVVVKYVNYLHGRHPVQGSIDYAIMGNSPRATYPIGRAAPHLHGGFSPVHFDGNPHSWWTADGKKDPVPRYYSLPGAAHNEATGIRTSSRPPCFGITITPSASPA